jgi:all-trans-retinol 13,14-reductase
MARIPALAAPSASQAQSSHAIAIAAATSGVTEFSIGMPAAGAAFPCRPGQSVLDAANAADVPLPQSCGESACGTCRVRVLSGNYETDTRGMFSADELAGDWRLACQTLPTQDLLIALEQAVPDVR